MPIVNPDFSEELKPIPAGTYMARIVGGETKLSKGSDGKPPKPYVNWKFELFGDANLAGRNVFYMTMLGGFYVTKLKKLHKAVFGTEQQPGPFDTDDWLGKELQITCIPNKQDPENGMPEVTAVAPLN